MSSDHERGSEKEEFCALPGDGSKACKCGNNFRTVCKPSWGGHTFERYVRRSGSPFTFDKEYEAHHVLCVSCVSREIVGCKDIDAIVRMTVWCINKKRNMLGMPLWGHTVKWYCEITSKGGEIDEDARPPKFKNIPQHDFDHNCNNGYTDEVTKACKDIAKKAKEGKKSHKAKGKALAGKLDSESSKWKKELGARGERKGGTHKAWKKASTDSTGTWCQPFSMASDAFVSSKSFPVRDFDEKVSKWIDRIAKAIRNA